MDAPAQTRFAAALLDPGRPLPEGLRAWNGSDPARRFAVYRNNVIVSLIDGLAARFPVAQALVGTEFFRAMARLYVQGEPPRSRLLHEYGETFPGFIREFSPARDVPYLVDVAQLEAARTRAYHAADADPMPSEAFAAIASDAAARLAVRLHPSVQLVVSPWPVLSIWLAHEQEADPALSVDGSRDLSRIDLGLAESVLIARPNDVVRLWRLPPGGAAFLEAAASGSMLAEAAARAAGAARDFDLAANLTLLIQADIAVGLSFHGAAADD